MNKEMKTLEELGFKAISENQYSVLFECVIKHPLIQHIQLFADGDYTTTEGRDNDDIYLLIINQELHQAIENEMKKRGWWK